LTVFGNVNTVKNQMIILHRLQNFENSLQKRQSNLRLLAPFSISHSAQTISVRYYRH